MKDPAEAKEAEAKEQAQKREREERAAAQKRAEDAKSASGESDPNLPAWLVNLPPEIRRVVTSGDLDKVPPEYQELLRRYQRWLLENAARDAR